MKPAKVRPRNAVQKAVSDAGGRAAVALRMEVTRETVRVWEVNGRVPPARVLELVGLTGRKVTPHALCPDIFTDPAWMPPEPMPKRGARDRGSS